MKHLLDVSALVALVWKSHEFHERAWEWREGKKLAVCPIVELGFIRVSTSPGIGASMNQARTALEAFLHTEQPDFVADDLRVLSGRPAPSSKETTDWHLADLAEKNGMKWATLDGKTKHPAAALI